MDGPNEGWGSNGLDLLLASVDDGGSVVVVLLGGGDGLGSTSETVFYLRRVDDVLSHFQPSLIFPTHHLAL